LASRDAWNLDEYRRTRSESMRLLVIAALSFAALAGCTAPSMELEGANQEDVVTRACPTALEFNVGRIHADTLEDVQQNQGVPIGPEEQAMLDVQLPRLRSVSSFEAKLTLDRAEGAVCTYKATDPGKKTKANFHTNSGKKILRVDGNDAPVERFS